MTTIKLNKHTVKSRIEKGKLVCAVERKIDGVKWVVEVENVRTAYFYSVLEQIERYTEYDDDMFQLAGMRVTK